MDVGNKHKKAAAAIPYFTAFIICLCISLPVMSRSVVLDDAYSITLVRENIGGIIQGTASDVHPPLYYLILKFCSFFGGESLIKYRIVTFLPTYLNLLVLGATLIRKRWGWRTAVFYILWLGSVRCTFDLSALIRMYSWAAFFVSAASLHVFFYYENGRRKDYILGILMTLAAMYSHYFAAISVFMIWVTLLTVSVLRKKTRIRRILLGGIIIGAGYLPWLRVLLSQTSGVAENYWISGFEWGDWFSTPAQLMESPLTGMGTVLYFLLFAMFLLACLRRKWDALLFFLAFAGTMILGALLSILIAPVWQHRYLYVAWGLLSLFAAIVAGEKVSPWSAVPQLVLSGILCIVLFYSVQNILQDGLMSSTDKEWTSFIETALEPDALVIVDDPSEHSVIFEYYLPEAAILMTEQFAATETNETAAGTSVSILNSVLEQSSDKQVWYIIDHVQARLGHDKMAEILEKYGLQLDKEPMAEYSIKYKNLGIYKVTRTKSRP